MYLDVPIPEIALDTKDQIVVDVQPTIETKVDNSLTVEAIRKQYAIVGDALFAVQTTDEAPPWLTDILDSVISDVLDPTKQDLDQANQNIIQALKDLDVAKNQYEELINIEATIDTIIASRLATLNASMDLANANIIELQVTKVTEDEAIAIAAQQVAASVGPLEENVNSSISIIQTSVAELNVSMDNQYAQLNDNMEELDLALTSQITQLEVNVGENMAKLIEDMTTYTDSSGRSLGKYSVALDLVGKDPEGRESKLVGGFILAGDTAEGIVKAGFDVDTFYVGRQGSNGHYPFEVAYTALNDPFIRLTGFISVEGQVYSHNFPFPEGDIAGSPSGFRLSSTAKGTNKDPHVYGGVITGSEISGSTISGGTLIGSVLRSANSDFIINLDNRTIYIR